VLAESEEGSLAQMYARYSCVIFRRARRLLKDEEAAADATHEVFLRLLRDGGSGAFEANPMAWLLRTTTNFCLNSLRDGRRRSELMRIAEAVTTGNDVDALVTLRSILKQIPDDLRDVAVNYYLDGRSQDEIAAIVGLSRRTVCNRLASFHAAVGKVLRPTLDE
jgi:RNA polymerase sigma-70 factor, ECF subfamily